MRVPRVCEAFCQIEERWREDGIHDLQHTHLHMAHS